MLTGMYISYNELLRDNDKYLWIIFHKVAIPKSRKINYHDSEPALIANYQPYFLPTCKAGATYKSMATDSKEDVNKPC